MAALLYVIGSLDLGGTERHLAQVLPGLKARGFEPVVFTLSHPGSLAPGLQMAGVRVLSPYLATRLKHWPAWIRKPVLFPLCILAFYQALWRLRPQLLHFYLPQAYLIGGLLSWAVQWVTPRRSRPLRVMSRRSLNHYQQKHLLLASLERWLHGTLDALLGNSAAVIRDLKGEGVPERRLHLIYNGVDASAVPVFPVEPEFTRQRQATRQRLGLSDRALLLVCVANLIPYKGHRDLLQALGLIARELPADWALLLVGAAPSSMAGQQYEQALREQATDLGISSYVHFLGQRNDALGLYAAADMGVLCSHEEGFSNSVLEGMAAGAAMVVTDVGGNAEAVVDGECGWVVPARNPAALGLALFKLAQDPGLRVRFTKASQVRVAAHFSLDACVNQYAQLYQNLLESRR